MKIQILVIALFFAFSSNLSAQEKTIDGSFLGVKTIKLDLSISGVEIGPSPSAEVWVNGTFDESEVEAEVWKDGSTLQIDEKLKLRQPDGQHSEWKLLIPDGMYIKANLRGGQMVIEEYSGEIEGNCGTGGLTITNFKGEIDWNCGTGDYVIDNAEGNFSMNTGTGSYRLENVRGKISANTGTGKVKIENCQGGINANSGTGDVNASNIAIEKNSTFNSGTGDVKVKLGENTHADLFVNSGTGNAELDLNGHDLSGTLTMYCSEEKGDISSPFEFDKTWTKGNGGKAILFKSKSFGDDGSEVEVGTGTGNAVVTN